MRQQERVTALRIPVGAPSGQCLEHARLLLGALYEELTDNELPQKRSCGIIDAERTHCS